MKTDELVRKLKTERGVVFGTGYVARVFSEALALRGLTDGVEAYAETDPAGKRLFSGKPVVSLADLAAEGFAGNLYLAVHEALADRLLPELQLYFPDRVVWIYPHLTWLLYGEPKPGGEKDTDALLGAQDPALFWITVRYAAARGMRERGGPGPLSDGERLYVRALAIHCGEGTARARLQKLGELLASMEEDGYDPAFPILIDENGLILDGLHRFAVSCLLGMPRIPCVTVPVSPVSGLVLTAKNRLPETVLREAGFTDEEREFLKERARELFGRQKSSIAG